MNEDLKNISAARRLVRQISTESCLAYNQLCPTEFEGTAFTVLEGQLRMASKLAELEKKHTENG